MPKNYPGEFLAALQAVTGKRARTVIQHILRYGSITSRELMEIYGYNHPPRAIRDVREHGIPIETTRINGSDGRQIAVYRFGVIEDFGRFDGKDKGRSALSRKLKRRLIEKNGARCALYLAGIDASLLQVDHRIPYEIGGECDNDDLGNYMLLSPSANRMKSWTCEHCENWRIKNVAMCKSCFLAYPEKYDHIAGRKERVAILHFSPENADDFDQLQRLADAMGKTPAEVALSIIHDALK